MDSKENSLKFQFITHCNEKYSYTDSAQMALEGGCRWIQLRMKEADEGLMEQTARTVQKMCKEHGATFIINDNVMLAKRMAADGVHLGKGDMPLAEARKILGDRFIIGYTVNCYEDIRQSISATAPDYIGCGPFRFTATKKNLAPILGHSGYKNIINEMRNSGISIPLVAIGGIRKDDIGKLLQDGVDGIAMSSSILNAKDPVREIQKIIDDIRYKSNPLKLKL